MSRRIICGWTVSILFQWGTRAQCGHLLDFLIDDAVANHSARFNAEILIDFAGIWGYNYDGSGIRFELTQSVFGLNEK